MLLGGIVRPRMELLAIPGSLVNPALVPDVRRLLAITMLVFRRCLVMEVSILRVDFLVRLVSP